MKKREVLLLSGIVLLSCIVSAIYAIFCNEPYNDVASRYLIMVRAFTEHNWGIAFSINQPVIVPALGGLICAVTSLNSFSSLMISSSLFYILAIFPLYYFLKYFFKGNINLTLLGCLLYVTAPKIIRWGCVGYLDPGKNFFIILSFALLLSFFERKRIYKAAFLGISLAGLTLVRAEGIGFVGIIFILALIFYFREENPVSLKTFLPIIKSFIFCIIFFFIFISPRLIQVYNATGVPFTDARLASFFNIQPATSVQPVQLNQPNPNKETNQTKATCPIIETKTITNINNLADSESPIGHLSIKDKISIGYIRNFLTVFSQGAFEFYLILGAVGLFSIIIRRNFRFEMVAPLFVVVCGSLFLCVLALTARYFSWEVLLLMPFTVIGFTFVYEQIKRVKLQKIAIIAFIVILILQINNGLDQAYSRSDAVYRLTGEWIQSHKKEFTSNPKLKIVADMPQFFYWADAEGLNLGSIYFSRNIVVPTENELKTNDVPLIVVRKKNIDAVKALSVCPYLTEINQPYEKESAVYKIDRR